MPAATGDDNSDGILPRGGALIGAPMRGRGSLAARHERLSILRQRRHGYYFGTGLPRPPVRHHFSAALHRIASTQRWQSWHGLVERIWHAASINKREMVSRYSVPQTQPRASYIACRSEIDAAISRVLAGGQYILGEETSAFENAFATFVGARHGVGVGSGTDALILGLRALGVERGDGVVTVSHTSVATVAAIELVGAHPIFVDVEADGYTMDPADLGAVLDRPPRPVKAIVPVHLYGAPARMPEICALARLRDVPILEDASQAHGAAIGGRQVGTIGAIGAFSLYPTKNLGALGDAGIIVTQDESLATRIRSLRQYGWNARKVSAIAGMNSRLDEVQAAILNVKLRHLDRDNARRQAIARAYDGGLRRFPAVLPLRRADTSHVFHQYVIQVSDRDTVRDRLRERGVETALHYPLPVHMQDAYRGRIAMGPAKLANTEALAHRILSLPMYPQLDDRQVAQVIKGVGEVLAGVSHG